MYNYILIGLPIFAMLLFIIYNENLKNKSKKNDKKEHYSSWWSLFIVFMVAMIVILSSNLITYIKSEGLTPDLKFNPLVLATLALIMFMLFSNSNKNMYSLVPMFIALFIFFAFLIDALEG